MFSLHFAKLCPKTFGNVITAEGCILLLLSTKNAFGARPQKQAVPTQQHMMRIFVPNVTLECSKECLHMFEGGMS